MKNIKYLILLSLFTFECLAQNLSSGVVELRVPIWSLINLHQKEEKDQLKDFHRPDEFAKFRPGKEITIAFDDDNHCIVEISRVFNDKLLTDISECDHVIQLTKLIPKGARLKREFSPIWFRPISEQERLEFPLNKDSPLIVGRLPAQDKFKVMERTNYKQYFRNRFQFWYRVKNKLLIGWVPEDELIFEETNTDDRALQNLKRLKVRLVKTKRKNKFSPGFFLDLNYQARLNNISEEDLTNNNKLGYVQNSYLTLSTHLGYVRPIKYQIFSSTMSVSYNNSNDGTKIPISYSVAFDGSKKLDNGVVPSFGFEYEYVPSFNVGTFSSTTGKQNIDNSMAFLRVSLEKKIFSLQDIGKMLGLHHAPMAKNLFRLLDHSFYLKVIGSYLVWSESDYEKEWEGIKIYSEVTSKIFKDINVGGFFQMSSIRGQTRYSGQRLGILVGYSFF